MAEITQDELLKQLRGVQRIVINASYGGFSLSRDAILVYLDLAGILYELLSQPDRERQLRLGDRIVVNGVDFESRDIPRDDPALVSTVRRLGRKSWGEYATLKVVEVPSGVQWTIQDYDGREWIAEVHRTWR